MKSWTVVIPTRSPIHTTPTTTSLFHDRQVTAALVRHGLHALIYRGRLAHGDDRAGHDLANPHSPRGMPFDDHLPHVVAFGNRPN